MSADAWPFTITVTRAEAYDVVETGHVATVDIRTENLIVVFDYTIDAYQVQRRYHDGEITTVAEVGAESVVGSPFAPFGPGVHWVPDRIVDSVPRDEITLTIGGTDAQTPSPDTIADPANFDEAVRLATEDAAAAVQQFEATETLATERLRELEASARARMETASIGVDESASIAYEQQVGDPVLVASGKLILSESDMAFPVGPLHIDLRRVYRSSTDGTGSFGPGWASVLDSRIVFGVTPGNLELAEAASEAAGRVSAGVAPEAQARYEHALSEITIASEHLAEIRDAAERAHLALDRYHHSGPARAAAVAEVRRLTAMAVSLRNAADARIAALRDQERRLVDSFTRTGEELPLVADQLRRAAETYLISDSTSGDRALRNNEFLPGSAGSGSPGIGNNSVVVVGMDGIGHRYVESPEESGFYMSPTRRDASLREERDGSYSLLQKDGAILTFGRSGELRAWLGQNGTGFRFEYDAQSRLSILSDTYGREIRLHRDQSGLIRRLEGPLGYEVRYDYDSQGRLVTVTDAVGDATRYRYEGDRVVKIVRPDTTFREYRYAKVRDSWRVVSATDEEGFSEYFDYSQPGRTIHTSAGGIETTHSYDGDGRTTEVAIGHTMWERFEYLHGNLAARRDSFGNLVSYQYDEKGNVTMIVYPDGTSEQMSYTDTGQIAAFTSRSHQATQVRYDQQGNLVEILYPDSTSDRYTHNPDGTVASHTDRRGNTRRYTYNGFGQPRRTVDDVGLVAETEADALGRVTSTYDGVGRRTTFEYRHDGLLAAETTATGQRTEYRYNGRKDLVSVLIGHDETKFSYNARHQVIEIIHPTGDTVRYVYDGDGNLTSVSQNGWNVASRTYNDMGQLRTSTRGEATTTYTYDGPRIRRIVDANGHITDLTHSWNGLVERRTRYLDGVPLVEHFQYGPDDRPLKYVDAAGAIWRWSHDDLRGGTTHIDPNGGTTSTFLDPYGLPLREVDELGRDTRYSYDSRGRLTETGDASGAAASYTYDLADRITSYADRSGGMTRYTYDDEALTVEVTQPDGTSVHYRYAPDGVLESITNELGAVTRLEYDPLDRLVAMTDPAGNVVTYTYQFPDLITSVSDQTGGTWRYDYDGAGHPISVIDPMGATTAFDYDPAGNVLSQTDPTGRRIEYTYDSLGRVRSITRAGEPYVSFTYDGVGNITAETDGAGNAHRYRYDTAGNLVSETNRVGDSLSYVHDAAGRLIESVDFNGTVGRFSYDELDNLAAARYSDGTQLIYRYDPAGRLLSAENASEMLKFTYDVAGNLFSVAGSATGTSITYKYDDAGRRTEMMDHAENRLIRYRYDALDRIIEMDDTACGVTTMAYDAAGRRTEVRAPNGVVTRTTYDRAGRVAATVVEAPSGEVLDGLAHVRDEAGRRLFDVDHRGRTGAYQYDGAGRLAAVQRPFDEQSDVATGPRQLPDYYLNPNQTELGRIETAYRLIHPLSKNQLSPSQPAVSQSFRFDGVSLQSIDGPFGTSAARYHDAADRLVMAGETMLRYDRNGNMVQQTDHSDSTTTSYGALGRAMSTSTDYSTVSFEYDALGRRISRTEERGEVSTTSITRYDGLSMSPISVRTVSATPTGSNQSASASPSMTNESYPDAGTIDLAKAPIGTVGRYTPLRPSVEQPGGGVQIATLLVLSLDGAALHISSHAADLYLSSDNHNTVRIATDGAGSVTRRYNYDSFGAPLGKLPDAVQPFGFAGKRYDPVTRLYDFGYRCYSPELGIFVTPDPLRDQANWYTFASLDPINFVDPLGLLATGDLEAAYAEHYKVLQTAFDPINRRRSLQDSIRNAPMYQPHAGGNFNRSPDEGLYWCNQATYDYVAARSPYLFRIMSGGEDRTDPRDRSYAPGSDANSAVARLRDAAREGRIGTTTSTDRAATLLRWGYTVVAAATGDPRGHLTVGRPSEDGEGPLMFSNVGRRVGDLNLAQSFPGSDVVEFYYDVFQDRSRFDHSQVLNYWSD